MKRITASHPDYEEINRHNLMLCLLKNPGAHFNTQKEYAKSDKLVWESVTTDVEAGLQDLLKVNPFKEFLEK